MHFTFCICDSDMHAIVMSEYQIFNILPVSFMQIQTRLLSTNMVKVAIAIKGKANVNSGLLAVQARQDSTDQRIIRVTGTIALKRGWKTSVKMFTKDDNWVTKKSSGFGCHLLKTFSGCTTNQQAEALVQVFSFFSNKLNNDSDAIADFDTNDPPENPIGEVSSTSTNMSYKFMRLFLVISLIIPMMLFPSV